MPYRNEVWAFCDAIFPAHDFCNVMSNRAFPNSEKGLRDTGLPPCAATVQQGYRTYIRDLPGLLRSKREGYMVAYRGTKRLDMSRSGLTLRRTLAKRPDYDAIKDELFVTRVTLLDADEHGISLKN
jgi:hypothetical protein